MKKSIILALSVLVSFGISTILQAQSTTHHKKKKTTHHTSAARSKAIKDSLAAAASADSMATLAAVAPTADTTDTSKHVTDMLVADTSVLAYTDFNLDSTRPIDGFYKIPLLRGAKPFALPNENKYDIKFYKRLWRTIDLTDSLNKIFATPGETLMGLIMDAIKAGKLIPYQDEKFTSRYTYEKLIRKMSDSSVVPEFDSTGVQVGSHSVFNAFNPESISKFEIKEDIFYDKVHGRLITEIVGLAPVLKIKTSGGDYVGTTHPFWLYFPQCRTPFASREVYDTQRDVYNVSYDDVFIQHNFRTQIVKESSPDDLSIEAKYPNDEEKQKKEADRIEKELRDFQTKLWKYK